MAFAIYGMAVVVAPAIGPTIGGWITDNYSWHWIFYINVPVGIVASIGILVFIREARHAHREAFDFYYDFKVTLEAMEAFPAAAAANLRKRLAGGCESSKCVSTRIGSG